MFFMEQSFVNVFVHSLSQNRVLLIVLFDV